MGIGPQNLGAAGMNPKSTPCGHSTGKGDSPMNYIDPNQQLGMQPQQVGMQQPGQIGVVQPQNTLQQPVAGSPVNFNEKLEAAVDSGKITGKFANIVKANV